MTQIVNAVLFVSKFSEESKKCSSHVLQSRLPIAIVPLDSKKARNTAKNGNIIQIKNVPSLVVERSDGNVQLFVGTPKISSWLSAMSSPRGTQEPPLVKNDYPDKEDEIVIPKKKVKKGKKKRSKEIEIISNDNSEILDDPMIPSIPNNTGSNPLQINNIDSAKPNNNIMEEAKKMMRERENI